MAARQRRGDLRHSPLRGLRRGPHHSPEELYREEQDIQSYTARDVHITQPEDQPSVQPHTIYAIAMSRPFTGELTIHTLYAYTDNPYLVAPVWCVQLLGASQAIPFQQHEDGLLLQLPRTKPNDSAYVYRIRKGACKAASD